MAAIASVSSFVAPRAVAVASTRRQIVAQAASPAGNGGRPSTRRALRRGRAEQQSMKAVIHPTDGTGVGRLTPDMSPMALTGNKTGVAVTGVWQPETGCILFTAELEQGTLYVGVDSSATQERPGNGGLRIRAYPTPAEAKQEAINLSEAMSFKHGVYNTGFSGAKLVFDTKVDVSAIDKEQLMDRVAEVLEVRARLRLCCRNGPPVPPVCELGAGGAARSTACRRSAGDTEHT